MPDVSLRFQGESVGAVQATKNVDEALGDLSNAALQAQASLRQALDGVNGDPAEREIQKVEDALEDTAAQAVVTRGILATMFSGLDTDTANQKLALLAGGIAGIVGGAGLLGSAFGDFKLPAMWAGLDIGIQFIGAMGAALVALVSAIGPAVGALVAVPSGMTAIVQAAATVKLAFFGIADALSALASGDAEKIAAAMEKLGPAAQSFATALFNLKPKLDELRAVAAAGLLPGVEEGMLAAVQSFGVFRAIIGDTAVVLGNFARNLGEAIGSPEWRTEIASIGEQNTRTLDKLGQAFINLGDAALSILEAAGPFIDWMADGIVAFSEWAEKAADAGQESGRLAGFFDAAKVAMQLLWDVAKPLGEILLDIGRAAAPLGREILRDLAESLERLSEWTGSEGGQETMKAYFQNAQPVIYETARLIRDIGKAFFEISNMDSSDSALLSFINRLRTEVLPLFKEVTETSGDAFGATLSDAIINIAKLFLELSGPNGPLVTLVGVIGDVAGGFADFLAEHDGIRDMIFTLTGLLTWAKLIALTGIVGYIVAMAGALLGMVAPALAARLGMEGLNASIRANAIGAIVTVIQLLVAAFIVAYTQSETFRNIVDQTWAAIKVAAEWTIEFAKTLWDLVKPLVDLWLRFSPIMLLLRAIPDVVRDVIAVFRTLAAVVGDVSQIMSNIVGALRGFVDNFTKAAANLGKAIYNGIVNGVTGVANEVGKILGNVIKYISDRVSAATAAARKFGLAIFNGIKNTVTGIASEIGKRIGAVVSTVIGWVTRAATAGRRIGGAIKDGVIGAVKGVALALRAIIEGAINSVLRIINRAIGMVNSALSFRIDVPDQIPGLGDVLEWAVKLPYVPYLAKGGIVSSPTLAMIGEAGPEAVVPLPDRADLFSGGGPTVNVHVGGSVITERKIIDVVRDGIIAAQRRDSGYLGGGAAAVPR